MKTVPLKLLRFTLFLVKIKKEYKKLSKDKKYDEYRPKVDNIDIDNFKVDF
jgi:hypothetical protein